MNKYERLIKDLREKGEGSIKMFGNSMTPLIKSGTVLTFKVAKKYNEGDVVFCYIKGRFYAHKIIKKGDRGYLIGNNKGRINGWTRTVYGVMCKEKL